MVAQQRISSNREQFLSISLLNANILLFRAETIDDDERDDSGDSQDGNGNDDDGDNEADGHGNNDDGDNEADGNGSDGQGSDCEDEGNTAVGGSTPPTNDAKDGKSKPLKPTKADTPGPSTRAKTDAKGVAVTRPEWMSHSKNYLLGIEGRDSWEKLVQSWMVFEERLGYPDREVSFVIPTLVPMTCCL